MVMDACPAIEWAQRAATVSRGHEGDHAFDRPCFLATLLALCVALTACSSPGGSDGRRRARTARAGSADASGTTTPTETTEPTEGDEAAATDIMNG